MELNKNSPGVGKWMKYKFQPLSDESAEYWKNCVRNGFPKLSDKDMEDIESLKEEMDSCAAECAKRAGCYCDKK